MKIILVAAWADESINPLVDQKEINQRLFG